VKVELLANGFGEEEAKLVRLLAMLTDLRPFWPKVVPLFIAWMREQFGSEGEWGGDPWAPLSEAYNTRKQEMYPGRGILYATGDLRRSASNPQRIATPQMLSLIIDDADKRHGGKETRSVAEYHQEGTPTMPARPIIPAVLPPKARLELEAVAEEWILEMQERLGLTAA
jgi:hypothetical protein